MIDALFTELSDYISHLEKEFQFRVVFCDFTNAKVLASRILKHHIHDNSYCMCIKSNKVLWDECLSKKCLIYDKMSDGAFFGMCYAGVEEYIIPVIHKGKKLGFFSVGSYRVNEKKAQRRLRSIATRHDMSQDVLNTCYHNGLTATLPDRNEVFTVFSVAARLLGYIYDEMIALHGEGGETDSNEDYIYQHILSYINQNYMNKIGVEEICDFCHYSKSYINHMFKKNSGKNIKRFINDVRIEKAKEMLCSTRLSVKEIAFTVGFCDSNYFSSVFAGTTGLAPGQYRKERKSDHFLS